MADEAVEIDFQRVDAKMLLSMNQCLLELGPIETRKKKNQNVG